MNSCRDIGGSADLSTIREIPSVSIPGSDFGSQTWLYLWYSRPMVPDLSSLILLSNHIMEMYIGICGLTWNFCKERGLLRMLVVCVTPLSQREILEKFLDFVFPPPPPKSKKVSRSL
ncbi:hypothetical protein VNO77_23199 [Canavalia gladiata]|uniref:Uncharacterized protein n=1 Tax=Canavalia gladiata TaxID=3824 RepID=A0AAN9L4J0_CANGL